MSDIITNAIDNIKCALIGHKFIDYPYPDHFGIWFSECDRCGIQRTQGVENNE